MAKDFEKLAGKNSIIKEVAKKASLEGEKRQVSLKDLVSNPHNGEIWEMSKAEVEALSEGIKRRGFEGSIGVYELKNGKYEIYDGHMRAEAAKLAGLKTIPVHVKKEPDEKQKWDDLISSNMDGRKVTTMEKAKAVAAYKEHVLPNATTKELADHFGISAASVSVLLSLTKCIPEIQALTPVANEKALANLKDLSVKDQKKLAETIKDRIDRDIPVTGKDIARLAFNIRSKNVIVVKEHTRKRSNDWSDFKSRTDSRDPLNEHIPTELESVCLNAIERLKSFSGRVVLPKERESLQQLIEKAQDLINKKGR